MSWHPIQTAYDQRFFDDTLHTLRPYIMPSKSNPSILVHTYQFMTSLITVGFDTIQKFKWNSAENKRNKSRY